jgi:predicted dehydrogenase
VKNPVTTRGTMRVGMVGLAALYWPIAIGNGLKAHKTAELVAAATLDVEDAQIQAILGISSAEYSEKFGVTLYSRAEDMVETERLTTVVLNCRHSEHALWAERMAKLGMDIFIPKTFATTLEDADRIAQAEERFGVTIASGPSARYLPPVLAIKDALDHDVIGQPFALRLCHHHGTIDHFNPKDWFREAKEGGPGLSLGWYGTDLILYLMGQTVTSVYAEYGNYTTPYSPFLDCGKMVMRLSGGGIASFDIYYCNRMPYPSWQLELVGPKGLLSIHRTEASPTSFVVRQDTANGSEILPLPQAPVGWEVTWVDEFLRGDRPAISADYARLITRISLAAVESASKGAPVRL